MTPDPHSPTEDERRRARRIGRLACDMVDDSLTMYGAEGSALLRMASMPGATDLEMAEDIARHYKPRAGAVQRPLF